MTAKQDAAGRLSVGALPNGKPFSLPAETITQASAILGLRESGKTNTAVVVVEELLARGDQVVIIDPVNVWWGLRASADGTGPGYPIIVMGGPRGDVPLNEHDGGVLADFVVETRASVILSLRHMRKGAQRRFVTEFCEQVFHRKGEPEYQTPVLVVIDEASQFLPQKVLGDQARMVGAVQDLIRMGRSSGIGVTLIDQRAATVNKDGLSQIELLVAHRHTSPQDRKAVREWIEQKADPAQAKEFLEGLASLPQGHGWFWSPLMDVFERVHVRRRTTFDSSKTPKAGERASAPARLTPIDLEALKVKLARTVEEARANDPKLLKDRIAELETEVEALEANDRFEAEERPLNEHERGDVHAEGYMKGRADARVVLDRANEFSRDVGKALATILTVARSFETTPIFELTGQEMVDGHRARTAPASSPPMVPPRPARSAISSEQNRNTKKPEAAGFNNHERKLLDAAAQLRNLRIDAPDRMTVAALAKVSLSSSATEKGFGSLIRRGFIEVAGDGLVRITDAGWKHAPDFDRLPTLNDYHHSLAGMLARLPHHAGKLMRVAVSTKGRAISRANLAELAAVSMTSSATDKAFGWLINNGLLEKAGDGMVRGGPRLFPQGLK